MSVVCVQVLSDSCAHAVDTNAFQDIRVFPESEAEQLSPFTGFVFCGGTSKCAVFSITHVP